MYRIDFEYECGDGCGTSWNWVKDTKFYTDYDKYIKELAYMKNSIRHRNVQ